MNARALFVSVLLCPLAGVTNRACADQTRPAQIDRAGLLILIRQTLIALDLSNKSGNYTILREISAPNFAATNDAAKLSRIFRTHRERSFDFSGALAYEPQMTVMPEINAEGMLQFGGFFPSASNQIKFKMLFAPVDGQWKIQGLAVDIAPAGPIAPAAAEKAPPVENKAKAPPPANKKVQ